MFCFRQTHKAAVPRALLDSQQQRWQLGSVREHGGDRMPVECKLQDRAQLTSRVSCVRPVRAAPSSADAWRSSPTGARSRHYMMRKGSEPLSSRTLPNKQSKLLRCLPAVETT